MFAPFVDQIVLCARSFDVFFGSYMFAVSLGADMFVVLPFHFLKFNTVLKHLKRFLINAITLVSHLRSPLLKRTQAVQHWLQKILGQELVLLRSVLCKEVCVHNLFAKKLFEIANISFGRSCFDDLSYLWR